MTAAHRPDLQVTSGPSTAAYRRGVDTTDRPDPPVDPRVVRTRQHVLAQARELLLDLGPTELTFSALATRAAVARKTLYRYWPGPEDLVADLILSRPVPPPEPAADVEEALRDYLGTLRAALEDRAAAAAYGFLMMSGASSPVSQAALRQVVVVRRAWLNERLAPLSLEIGEEDFDRLTGPLVAAHFVASRPITDEFVERIVRALASELRAA